VSGSIQLRKTRPSAATARFGCPLPGGAGDFISFTDGTGDAARARTALTMIAIVYLGMFLTPAEVDVESTEPFPWSRRHPVRNFKRV